MGYRETVDMFEITSWIAGAVGCDPDLASHKTPRAAIIYALDIFLQNHAEIKRMDMKDFAEGARAWADSIGLQD